MRIVNEKLYQSLDGYDFVIVEQKKGGRVERMLINLTTGRIGNAGAANGRKTPARLRAAVVTLAQPLRVQAGGWAGYYDELLAGELFSRGGQA